MGSKTLARRVAALEGSLGLHDGPVMPLGHALMIAVAALESPACLWWYPNTQAWAFPPQHLHHILPRISRQLGCEVTEAHTAAACRALTRAGFRSADDVAAYAIGIATDEQVQEAVRLGLEWGALRRDADGRLQPTTYTPRWQHLAARVVERARTIEEGTAHV